MPLIYNLPKLNNEDYPDPSKAGAWLTSGRLDDMANSLDIPSETAKIDDLKSLPDPWARPLLFNQALTTKGHIAKADAREQWRGLLALMALRQFYTETYTLKVRKVNLSEEGVGNATFRGALRRLRPADTILPGLDWNSFGVITITEKGDDDFDIKQERSIGLMVPNCLVAPARGARRMNIAGIPWMREGLTDPCTCDDIPGEQWVALQAYLRKLIERLQQSDISLKAAAIIDEISMFGRACQEQARAANAVSYTPDFDNFSDQLPHEFYSVLTSAPKPGEPDDDFISECEILLNPDNGVIGSGDRAGRAKLTGVLLLDPAIAGALDKRPQDVLLFKGHKLGTIDQGGNLAAMRRDAERDGYLVITPEQIFTDNLVRLVNEGRVESHGPKWESYLLPLSPLALFMVPRDRITHQLHIEDRGDRYEVRLTINLAPRDRQSRSPTHTISRFYDKQTQVAEESVPDDIILWPDVGTKKWPWNFMRYSFNSEYEMAPRFAASMRSLADTVTLRAKDSRDEAMALLKSLGSADDLIFERMESFFQGTSGELKGADGNLIAHRFRFTDLEDATGEQHILGQGADYLFFGMKPDDGGDIVPAGCLLLPERTATQGQGKMEVAVDFGTTNTVVYTRSGGKTERMVFEPRVSRPINSRLAEEDQFDFDCVEFFPSSEVVSPFPTVMHRRSFDLRGGAGGNDFANSAYHGVADNIFFMPEVDDKFGYAVERQERKQLAFDLKWSSDSDIRRMVKRFLRQIVLMSTVEAMSREITPGNIKWHFSYPQAWNRTQAGVFQTAVKNAWKEIMHPVIGRDARAEDYIEFETEGAAALRFFTDGPEHIGQAGRLIVMLDIGGGTTEIAIYHRDETVWRSSFRIAGGDFFTRFLSQNIAIFDQFRDGGSSIQDVLRKFGKEDSLSHFVELYISQPNFNETFSESFPMFSDEPEGLGLMNVATVALAGLCYYTGLVLRNLMRKGLVNEQDINTLTLAFAGRGSSFFSYLGKADDDMTVLGQVARMIADVAHSGAQDHEGDSPSEWELTNPRVRDLFSTHPKHEVAHGMLCGEGGRRSRARNTQTPLGETIEFANGETQSFTSDRFVEDLPSGVRLREVSEDEFDRFLKLLEIRTGLQVKIDSKNGGAREAIANDVDRDFSRALGALEHAEDDETGETLDIEPPFITKLRSLVHILARNIEERRNLLTVKNEDPKW